MIRLLAIAGSHPCAAAAAMLDAKGLVYERRDLVPGFSRLWLRTAGFPGTTVPALRLDGRRVQGSRAIARELDERCPDPPFFPPDPAALRRVERIEAWGDELLQNVTRAILLWALLHDPAARREVVQSSRSRIPGVLGVRLARPVIRLDAHLNRIDERTVRAALTVLPDMLERIDVWIAEGILGSDPPTAADYQLAGSLRALLTMEDLAPLFDDRPASRLASRLIPSFPGRVRAGVLA